MEAVNKNKAAAIFHCGQLPKLTPPSMSNHIYIYTIIYVYKEWKSFRSAIGKNDPVNGVAIDWEATQVLEKKRVTPIKWKSLQHPSINSSAMHTNRFWIANEKNGIHICSRHTKPSPPHHFCRYMVLAPHAGIESVTSKSYRSQDCFPTLIYWVANHRNEQSLVDRIRGQRWFLQG